MLLLFSAIPCLADSLLEGRITDGAKRNGAYDLLLQVWAKPGNSKVAKLLQTIQIPKVDVVDGGFRIPLDASLESHLKFELTYQVLSRPFEGGEPFQPAEVSRISVLSMRPGLTAR